MPFVVEISVAFSVLIAMIVIGVFLFRIRERFDSVDSGARRVSRRDPVSALDLNPVAAILVVPALAAAVLALLPGYRLSSRVNLGASLLTLLAACSLFVVERRRPEATC